MRASPRQIYFNLTRMLRHASDRYWREFQIQRLHQGWYIKIRKWSITCFAFGLTYINLSIHMKLQIKTPIITDFFAFQINVC
jgi:hypothetical protein